MEMVQEAFAINHTGKILAYIDGEHVYLKLVRLPNSAKLAEILRPRIKNRQQVVTAAQVSEFRNNYKTRVAHDLRNYGLFQ